MAFKPFEDAAKAREAEFYLFVSPEVRALAERPQRITKTEYDALRANSFERKLLHRNLDDEALASLTDYYLAQFRELGCFELARDYNDAVQRELAPLLVERLRAASARIAELEAAAQPTPGFLTADENRQLGELRKLVLDFAERAKKSTVEPLIGKSSDGCIQVTTPSWWGTGGFPWQLTLWHYPFGDDRHTTWEGASLAECLTQALPQVRAWIAEAEQP